MGVIQTRHIGVPEDARVDLRERIAATRWPGCSLRLSEAAKGSSRYRLALSLPNSPVVRPPRKKAT